MRLIGLLLIALCSLTSAAVADSTVTVYWNSTALEAIRQEHTPPTEAARAVGIPNMGFLWHGQLYCRLRSF